MTTEQAIKKATRELKEAEGDSESYHFRFDRLLEERLSELDPKFMNKMNKLYDLSKCSRWYA